MAKKPTAEDTKDITASEINKISPKPFIFEIREAIKSPQAIERENLDPVIAAELDDKITDTGLKKIYAYSMIVILAAQLIIMNIVFVLVGVGILKYNDPAHLKMFMGGTLAEVFGIVLVITRYLFSKNNNSAFPSKISHFLSKSKQG